jgi:hypothetical protein
MRVYCIYFTEVKFIFSITVHGFGAGTDRGDTIGTSVAEPEPQEAASFGRSRSRKAMRLRL